MRELLKIAGAVLGIAVPFLFILTLNKGVRASEMDQEQKRKYTRGLIAIVGFCTLLVWVLSLNRVLDYHPGDMIPRFGLPLIVFVFLGLYMVSNSGFLTILSYTPIQALVGVQAFRFAGIAFFIIAYLDILPASFMIAGLGDLSTGILAVVTARAIRNKTANAKKYFTLFNIVGLLDLLNVAILLFSFYPYWHATLPTSENATRFSLVLIPALVAPIAMLLHIYSIMVEVTYSRIGPDPE